MRAVEGEKREDAVIDRQRGDDADVSGHSKRPPLSRRNRRIAWLLVLAAEGVWLGFVGLGDARSRLPAYWFLAAAAAVLALLSSRILSGASPSVLLVCAALFRVTLLFRNPDLSDDIERYLWDARIAAAGVSPWAHPPEDPSLARIVPEPALPLPHGAVRTVYPPAAEAVFRAGSLGGRSRGALRALVAAADLAVVWLLARGAGASAAALYAFHPLPVLETAGQGHVDAVGSALLLAALAFLASRRSAAAGVAFALSVLTKYVPLAAVVPFVRRGGGRFALAAGAVAGGLWLAASRGGVSPAGGLADYATRWEFNAAAYPAALSAVRAADLPARAKRVFERAKARLGHPAWAQAVYPWFFDGFFARLLLAGVLATALAVVARRARSLGGAVFGSLAALTLCAPTLHPWYLLWTLPFAAARREPAFLYLSFFAPLAYGLLYPVRHVSRGAILAAEYLPFFALLAATLLRARVARAPRSAGEREVAPA
jgi:hypothetical protein